MTKDRFSFDAGALVGAEPITQVRFDSALSGTYRSNWSRLKHAAYSATFASLTNMANHLLPVAARIREKNGHPAEQAFLLSFNHSTLIGGPALGAVTLIAFAQESFLRLGYQLAEELRLMRSRRGRAEGFDRIILESVANLEQAPFPVRCSMLFKSLRMPPPPTTLAAFDLFTFRNTVAHDSPLLYLAQGREVAVVKGKSRDRRERIGAFQTLESDPCPVRLKHVKAAIDAHDELVTMCVDQARRPGWVDALNQFDGGVGLRIKEAFNGRSWYRPLAQAAKAWERSYQPHVTSPLESFLEMRDAIQRRAGMRRSAQPPSNVR